MENQSIRPWWTEVWREKKINYLHVNFQIFEHFFWSDSIELNCLDFTDYNYLNIDWYIDIKEAFMGDV